MWEKTLYDVNLYTVYSIIEAMQIFSKKTEVKITENQVHLSQIY